MRIATLLARLRRSLVTAWTPTPDGPAWSPWAWTLAVNTVVAAVLTAFVPVTGGLAANLLTSHAIGLSIHALFAGLGHGFRLDMFTLPAGVRLAYVMSVVLAGSWIGYALAAWIRLGELSRLVDHMTGAARYLLVIPVAWALATTAVVAGIDRLRRAQIARAQDYGARMHAEREAIAARLQLLNAQIEPHFLYNSLATLAALIPSGATDAQRLLDALVRYLRASSRNFAAPLVPLSQELDTVRGYLDVMQVRMGSRLRVRYLVPEAAGRLSLPPSALQVLVENAIRHGLEPSPGGGEILVEARRDRGAWHLHVEDTGRGLGDAGAAGSPGVGLANLGERLRLALGPGATLSLASRAGGGAVATLAIPDPVPRPDDARVGEAT